jgi:hypothetical protein
LPHSSLLYYIGQKIEHRVVIEAASAYGIYAIPPEEL